MILSKKTRYAIVALTRLAREYGNGPMQIREISESEKIPQSFLENILLDLKKWVSLAVISENQVDIIY